MAGPSFLFTTLLRIGGAIFLGVVLNQIYSVLGVLRDPVEIAWLPSGAPDADWPTRTLDGLRSLATIFLILLALLSLLKILEKTGVTAFLARALAPMLRLIGIGRGAVPLAMSGLLLGLNYGGTLMIREARFGTVSRRDVFLSICFLCLCHGVIEDTLLSWPWAPIGPACCLPGSSSRSWSSAFSPMSSTACRTSRSSDTSAPKRGLEIEHRFSQGPPWMVSYKKECPPCPLSAIRPTPKGCETRSRP